MNDVECENCHLSTSHAALASTGAREHGIDHKELVVAVNERGTKFIVLSKAVD